MPIRSASSASSSSSDASNSPRAPAPGRSAKELQEDGFIPTVSTDGDERLFRFQEKGAPRGRGKVDRDSSPNIKKVCYGFCEICRANGEENCFFDMSGRSGLRKHLKEVHNIETGRQAARTIIPDEYELDSPLSQASTPSRTIDSPVADADASKKRRSGVRLFMVDATAAACTPAKGQAARAAACTPAKGQAARAAACTPAKGQAARAAACTPAKRQAASAAACTPAKRQAASAAACTPAKGQAARAAACTSAKRQAARAAACTPAKGQAARAASFDVDADGGHSTPSGCDDAYLPSEDAEDEDDDSCASDTDVDEADGVDVDNFDNGEEAPREELATFCSQEPDTQRRNIPERKGKRKNVNRRDKQDNAAAQNTERISLNSSGARRSLMAEEEPDEISSSPEIRLSDDVCNSPAVLEHTSSLPPPISKEFAPVEEILRYLSNPSPS